MMLKMLKIKLRKMKGKGQITDPYLADFTQKIMDNKRNNEEVLNAEKSEAEDVSIRFFFYIYYPCHDNLRKHTFGNMC